MSQPNTQTTQGALLKELYTLPPVRVLNDKSFLHDKLSKESATLDFSGKYVRFPVTMQREVGFGSRSEGTTGAVLPEAQPEVDVEAKAFMKFNYFALEWTEAIEEVSKNKDGAFENVVARKMRNIATNMSKALNRIWYNDASDALEGNLATTSGAATVTTATGQYPQFVHIGDQVDIVNLSTGVAVTNGTKRTVTGISAAGVITFGDGGGNVAVTAGTHGLVVTGNWGNEPDGLRFIAKTGRTLHNIDSTTYPQWDGNVLNANGGVAGESLLEQLYDRIGERQGGNPDTALSTRGIRRRLADEFASQRRLLNESALNPKLGYSSITLQVGGQAVELVIDDDCPKGNVFMTGRDSLKLMQLTKPGFLESSEGDGARVELKDHTVAGMKVAAWQSWYRYHVTLVCVDPRRNGYIPDAEDDAPAGLAT